VVNIPATIGLATQVVARRAAFVFTAEKRTISRPAAYSLQQDLSA
jgi:hypothetical protein